MLPGFSARLSAELKLGAAQSPAQSLGLAAHLARLQVVPHPTKPERGYNTQRGHAAWVGGSIFASLDTFDQVAVTKAEWDEVGESIVHRKCF